MSPYSLAVEGFIYNWWKILSPCIPVQSEVAEGCASVLRDRLEYDPIRLPRPEHLHRSVLCYIIVGWLACEVEDIAKEAYVFRRIVGKNLHALLTAPNPERRPRMTVPTTIRRDRTVCQRFEVGNVEGSGTKDSKNRNPPTGKAVRTTLAKEGRCTVCFPADKR